MSIDATRLENQLRVTRRLLEVAASLIGLVIPTVALVRIYPLPPDVSGMAEIVLLASSLVLVLIIFIRGADIGRFSSEKAIKLMIVLALAGGISMLTYSTASDKLVITLTDVDTDISEVLIKPLLPSQRLRQMIEPYSEDYPDALNNSENSILIRKLMYEQRLPSVILLLATMLLSQLAFVASIVGGAWWLAERHVQPEPPPEKT